MKRSEMSGRERDLRSRLAKLVHENRLLRGNLTMRQVVCGKEGCRCADSEKHRALYLSSSQAGKTRQIYIPASLEKEVSRWVEDYQRVKEALEKISEISFKELGKRKKEK